VQKAVFYENQLRMKLEDLLLTRATLQEGERDCRILQKVSQIKDMTETAAHSHIRGRCRGRSFQPTTEEPATASGVEWGDPGNSAQEPILGLISRYTLPVTSVSCNTCGVNKVI
jgi:hypothetical protein